jgi:hypothetical protein
MIILLVDSPIWRVWLARAVRKVSDDIAKWPHRNYDHDQHDQQQSSHPSDEFGVVLVSPEQYRHGVDRRQDPVGGLIDHWPFSTQKPFRM